MHTITFSGWRGALLLLTMLEHVKQDVVIAREDIRED